MSRPFAAHCAACGERLLTVDRVGDAEVTAFQDHVGRCRASVPLSPGASLGEIMRRIRLVPSPGPPTETG